MGWRDPEKPGAARAGTGLRLLPDLRAGRHRRRRDRLRGRAAAVRPARAAEGRRDGVRRQRAGGGAGGRRRGRRREGRGADLPEGEGRPESEGEGHRRRGRPHGAETGRRKKEHAVIRYTRVSDAHHQGNAVRRRGRQPPADAARRDSYRKSPPGSTPTCPLGLRGPAQGGADRAGGDGPRGRPGGADARGDPVRAVEGERPLGRLRQGAAAVQGPGTTGSSAWAPPTRR